jgi:hypothetical protein
MRTSGVDKGAQKVIAQPAKAAVPALPKEPLGADNLMRLVDGLAKGFPDRVFGTETGRKSAEWMANQMKAIGLEPYDGKSYLQEFSWNIEGEAWPGQNVAGIMRGTDPKLANEFIVVAAHHDSQEDTRQGANDNASGCAGVLAIAQALAKDPPKRSVLFITFDGEEGLRYAEKYQPGRRGSKLYAERPLVPLAKTALLVNMDMIGQVHLERGPRSEIHQWASRDSFAQQVLAKASKATLQPGETAVNGYPEQHDQAQMFSTDAEPLYRLGVPTVNFLSGRDLDNHAPEDDMGRVIPERIAQYAKLCHQCVVEAANHPESLQQLGITPGGLMPTYPLIRANKSAGLVVPEEEQLRLNDLGARMPEFKAAALELARAVLEQPAHAEAAGLDLAALVKAHGGLVKEPVLAAVRAHHAALATALRDLDKNDLEARKPLLAKMEATLGIEDVISGAIYVGKIDKAGTYYMQQVPERLADLNRGARRLGLDAQLEGVVFEKDVVAFAPTVSAERAVFIARQTLAGLGLEVGSAAMALLAPQLAARTEQPVGAGELARLDEAILAAAREVAGAGGLAQGACQPLALQAALTAQISGVKGGGAKWVENFAAKNRFTDFAGLLGELGLRPADLARLTGLAEAMQAAPSAASITAYYKDLLATAAGAPGAVQSLEDLKTLAKPDAVGTLLAEAARRVESNAAQAVVQAAAGDAQVAALSALRDFLGAAFALGALFDPERATVRPDASLADVKVALDHAVDTAHKLGAGDVAAELQSFSAWLQPFLALEGRAKLQAKARAGVARDAQVGLRPLWQAYAAGLPAEQLGLDRQDLTTALGAFKALSQRAKVMADEGREDALTNLHLKRLAVMATVEGAINTLAVMPSPKAEANLAAAARQFEGLTGPAGDRWLQATLKELEQLHRLDDVQMGRGDRGGPLSVVAVRAALGREGRR